MKTVTKKHIRLYKKLIKTYGGFNEFSTEQPELLFGLENMINNEELTKKQIIQYVIAMYALLKMANND